MRNATIKTRAGHASETLLCKYVTRRLPALVETEVAMHLEGCSDCKSRAKALRSEFDLFFPGQSVFETKRRIGNRSRPSAEPVLPTRPGVATF
jgi:anti-sigma factor RsiW